MSYSLKKINDKVIKPLKQIHKLRPLKQEHIDLFGEVRYGLVLLLGARGLGKTTVVWEMMKDIIHKRFTQVYIFSSTAGLGDLTWDAILKEMKKQRINVSIFNDIENFDENIKSLVEQIKPDKKEPKKKRSELFKLMMGETDEEDDEEKKEHQKYEVIDYVLIIDDMGTFTRYAKWFDILCKTLRHYNSFIFIASQYLSDQPPGIRTVANFLCLFKNIGEKKLKMIYDEKINKEISYDVFKEIYDDITNEEKHNFLYVRVEDDKFYKNLNEEIIIK